MRSGGFGGEPFVAWCDEDVVGLAFPDQFGEVRRVWKSDPEVESARWNRRELRERRVFGDAVYEKIPARSELLAETPEVCLPTGLGDDVEGSGLQDAADVHRRGGTVSGDSLTCWSAGDDRSDSQCGGNAFGE